MFGGTFNRCNTVSIASDSGKPRTRTPNEGVRDRVWLCDGSVMLKGLETLIK